MSKRKTFFSSMLACSMVALTPATLLNTPVFAAEETTETAKDSVQISIIIDLAPGLLPGISGELSPIKMDVPQLPCEVTLPDPAKYGITKPCVLEFEGKTYEPGDKVTVTKETNYVKVLEKTDEPSDSDGLTVPEGYTMYSATYPESSADNGYGFPPNTQIVAKTGPKYTVPKTPTPKKAGYEFTGYAVNGDETKPVAPGSTITLTEKTELTPIYKENADEKGPADVSQYEDQTAKTLVLNYPESTSIGEALTYYSKGDVEVTLPAGPDSKVIGYAETKDATTAKYKVGDKITLKEAQTVLYAVYQDDEPAAEESTVKFALDGATNTDAFKDATVKAGDKYTIPETVPEKEGYTFSGWSVNGATDTTAKPGDTIVIEKDTTLTALWKQNSSTDPEDTTYTVEFDLNGAEENAAFNDAKVKDGETYTIPAAVPVQKGFTFEGWQMGDKTLQPGDTITVSGDVTLRAVFKANEPDTPDTPEVYTITFDANGGTGAPGALKAEDGKAKLPSDVPVRDGYKFLGWSANKDADKATYSVGESVLISKDMTLYAVWEKTGGTTPDTPDTPNNPNQPTNPDTPDTPSKDPVTITIAFDANGGSGGPAGRTVDKTLPYEFKLPDTYPLRAKYTFEGWKLGNTTYKPGDTVKITDKSVIFVAQWKANSGTAGTNNGTNSGTNNGSGNESNKNNSATNNKTDKTTNSANNGKKEAVTGKDTTSQSSSASTAQSTNTAHESNRTGLMGILAAGVAGLAAIGGYLFYRRKEQ